MLTVTLTSEEIHKTPNDHQLGVLVRKRLYELEGHTLDRCQICHKESPYTKSTHINERIGYVEGAGQGCFEPDNCNLLT